MINKIYHPSPSPAWGGGMLMPQRYCSSHSEEVWQLRFSHAFAALGGDSARMCIAHSRTFPQWEQ
jgi:hypothetical protein